MYYHKYIVQEAIESYNNYMGNEVIVDHLQFYDVLSSHVSLNDIIRNLDLPWNRTYLSCNPKLTRQNLDKIDKISTNIRGKWTYAKSFGVSFDNLPYITEGNKDMIISFYEKKDVRGLSNVALMGDRLSYYNKGIYHEISLYSISLTIDMETVLMYHNFPWSLEGLSSNDRLTMEVLTLDMPNAIDSWYIKRYTKNVIDINYNIIDSSINGDIVEVIYAGGIVKFDRETLFKRNDIKGHLMVHMNHVDASTIMNNIHLPWNFNRIVIVHDMPLRLKLLGKRIQNVFTPIKFTKMYHDIDIICS